MKRRESCRWKKSEIKTPICRTLQVKMLKGEDIAIVPILRAGLGMVDGMLALVPECKGRTCWSLQRSGDS